MRIEVLADGLGFTEGPVCLPDGRVAVTSISQGAVHLVSPDGGVETITTGGGPNGLALGPDGALYVAQNGGVWGAPGPAPAGVQVIRGSRVEYLTEGMGAPNDLMFDPDGALWVTDTVAAFEWGRDELARPGRVHVVDVGSGACRTVLEEGPVFTNGLAFTGDGRLLVSATLPREVVGYRITGDGLVDPEVVVSFGLGGPDGMCADGEGGYWVALTSAHRISRFSLEHGITGSVRLPLGSLPTNVCRDHAGDGLYVTVGLAGAVLHLRPEDGAA